MLKIFSFSHFLSPALVRAVCDSHAVKDSTKLSVTKKIHDGNIETSITTEKGSSFDKKC